MKFDHLTYDEFLPRGLKVADATSVSLCRDNDIDMIVFNLSEEGNIARVVAGEKIGTTVDPRRLSRPAKQTRRPRRRTRRTEEQP